MESAPPQVDVPAASSRRLALLLDPVLVGCFTLLLAFPLLATQAASGKPIRPAVVAPAEIPETAQGPRLRDLPAFTEGGAVAATVERGAVLTSAAAMRSEVRAAAAALVDRPEALEALAADAGAAVSPYEPAYPFRFERLDRVLDDVLPRRLDARQAEAANDLAALLVLAAARFRGFEVPAFAGAPPLAYALLDRARAGGGCLPQLNLAFLVATHERPRDAATAQELRRAEQVCRDDPTPLWLLGQYRSQRELRDPVASFRRLQERLPESSAGWAGEGDVELRAAYSETRPFTARSHFRRALALYRQARGLDPDPELAAGEARALSGLRLDAEAARAQRLAVRAADRPAELQARLVEYLERARRFGEAAGESAKLIASPLFPRGPALLMDHPDGPVGGEAEGGALSLGAGRLVLVNLDVAPIFEQGGGGQSQVDVSDLSFIPQFRDVPGLTGYDRWCPAWSHRRDLVLAGRPAEALAGFPRRFADVRPEWDGEECDSTSLDEDAAVLLAAVAELEGGERQFAVQRLRQARYDTEGERPLPFLLDARQELWRFAGDLDRAGRAAAEWVRVSPASATARDRAGEIAFLAGDYRGAARLFASAVRLTRRQAPASVAEALELLKLGTAQALAGRDAEALATLAESDAIASRAYATEVQDEEGDSDRAEQVSYDARLQAGDVHLRARRYEAAAELYAAAREGEHPDSAAGYAGPLSRPEVLENKQGIVEIRLGNTDAGLAAARRALGADPLSPVFLQNFAVALKAAGRPQEAADAYVAAVASDPTLYPAWNDLGVLRAGLGDLDGAVSAFRRAVGAREEYGLGWFNLGVALERQGPQHLLASQGAFARAFRADSELADRAHRFAADDRLYFTTLDLSKPLPPEWSFAKTQERAPVAVAGLALALLLGLQLSRGLGQGLGGDAGRWLELSRGLLARLPRALVSTTATVAVLVTMAGFLLPLLLGGNATWQSAVVLVVGVGLLCAIVLRARVLAARQAGVGLRQRGWGPGMAAGLATGAAGLAWAPLPVAETERPAPAVHWIGPLATGAAALGLLVLSVVTDVPAARALGAVALIMTASLLTPFEPLDGGHVAKGLTGLVANVALLGGAFLLLLGFA
jgi:hypothetical protein